MKKSVKIMTIVMAVVMIILSSTIVFAAPDPKNYTGNNANINTTKVEALGQNVVSVITTVGSIASVVVLVILGIKYMMGSAEEKAEYKKTLLPYVLGAVLVFGASIIASVIYGIASATNTWG